jgi:hypothetical protein
MLTNSSWLGDEGMSISVGNRLVLVDVYTKRPVNRSVATFLSLIEAFHCAFAARPVGTRQGLLAALKGLTLKHSKHLIVIGHCGRGVQRRLKARACKSVRPVCCGA